MRRVRSRWQFLVLGSIVVLSAISPTAGFAASTQASAALFRYGVFATSNTCGSITLTRTITNSFDSSLGTYAATKQDTGGDIGANGNMNLSGGAIVNGTASSPHDGKSTCTSGSIPGLSTSGGASAVGGLVVLGAPLTYVTPPAPGPLPPTVGQGIAGICGTIAGCTALSGSKNLALIPGPYGNVLISGGTTVHLSRGSYMVNSIALSGNSTLVIDSVPVLLNVAGQALGNTDSAVNFVGGTLLNPGGVPGGFQIVYAGTTSIQLAGGSASYGVVYAPNAPVLMSGGADWYGAVIGSTVTANIAIHYDRALVNASLAITATPDHAPNAAGWNNTNVTVNFACSGILMTSCPSPVSLATEGANQLVSGTAQDIGGNAVTASLTINLDKTAPDVSASRLPLPNAQGWNKANVIVSFAGTDNLSGIAGCSAPVTLTNEGANQSSSGTCIDRAGNTSPSLIVTGINIDKTPPVVVITSPANGATAQISPLSVTGTVTDSLSGTSTVTCNGTAAAVSGTSFNCTVPLTPGSNSINAIAGDMAGNTATSSVTVVNSSPPSITSVNPNSGQQGQTNLNVAITGQFTNFVNGTSIATFSGSGIAVNGTSASDSTHAIANITIAGNAIAGARNVTVTTDSEAVTLNNGFVIAPASSNLPPDPQSVAPPIPLTEATDFANATDFLYRGANPIQTGVSEGTISVVRAAVVRGKVMARDGSALPGVRVTILSHSEFGQTLSRADGMFDMAVNGGSPLTVSYAKAGFLPAQRQVNVPWLDFAFAADVVLIPFDTKATVIDLSTVPGATLASAQIARGNPVTDSVGTRQATLLFPQGVMATMVKPDGSTAPLVQLTVRATEYTVGNNGPQTMPGGLPPTSGYTYAVEFSVDEAIAAGATSVLFSAPVISYVEDFRGFPVGDLVPVGVYDREKGAWLSQPNGRVIRILNLAGGFAQIDTDGDGVADDGSLIGVTGIERQQLTTLYSPGTTLLRVPLTHFSTIDKNWPVGPPDDGRGPRQQEPTPPQVTSPDDPCLHSGSIIRCENQSLGEALDVVGTPYSLIYNSERAPRQYRLTIPLTVGETLPASLRRVEVDVKVAGRLFQATYAPAAGLVYTLLWDGKDGYGRRLQGEQPYNVEIRYVYPGHYLQPSPVSGSFPLIGFTYPVSWQGGQDEDVEYNFYERYSGMIGSWSLPPDAGVGGWSLSQHHRYDPRGQVLSLGNGDQQRLGTIGRVVTTLFGKTSVPGQTEGPSIGPTVVGADGTIYFVYPNQCQIQKLTPDGTVLPFAGNGSPCGLYNGDGIPATQANISVEDLAIGPDGSIYLTDYIENRIRRIRPDGIITTVVGNGSFGSTGDGGPATAASIIVSTTASGIKRGNLAIGPDGSIYFAQSNPPGLTVGTRIRRVGPEGTINTIAGTGVEGESGDGGPAPQATLRVLSMAIGPDGSIYLINQDATASNIRLRRITPDGIIRTISGQGPACVRIRPCGDGGPADQAHFGSSVHHLVVAADGNVYFIDAAGTTSTTGTFIRQISPDQIINSISGVDVTGTTAAGEYTGDGRQATATQLFTTAIAIAPDGTLIVSSNGTSFILVGSRAVVDKLVHSMRRLAPPSVLTTSELAVPAQNGAEIYIFTRSGRHLRTLNALTNAVLRTFSYDAAGRLIAITEKTGGTDNVTSIERDSAGMPSAIIGPFAQRTQLAVDANGYLRTVANPAGEAVQFIHDPTGLLGQLTDARGGIHRFFYDIQSRLTRDEEPDSSATTLQQTVSGSMSLITLTTAEGRVTTYRSELLPNGDLRRVITGPSGSQTSVLRQLNGTLTTTTPDGSVATIVQGPDVRWGLLTPVMLSQNLRLPSGLTKTITASQSVTLTNPADLFALQTLTESLTVNGRTTTSVYTAGTRTLVSTTPAGRKVTTVTDSLGRVISSKVGNLLPVNTTYDDRGRLVSLSRAGARTTTFEYDSGGYLMRFTDPLGNATNIVHDAAGRITSQKQPDNETVRFGYDSNGNLTELTPPGQPVHNFDYTPRDLTAHYASPGGVITTYEYNRDRQPTHETTPDGNHIDINYDGAGRLATQTIARGSISFNYDTADRLVQVNAPDGLRLTFSYDGLLRTSNAASGPIAGSITRSYDTSFRLTSLGLNGADISQVYDNDDFLTRAGSLIVTRDAQQGLVTKMTLGAVDTSRSYDNFGDATSETNSASGTQLYGTSYNRDSLGRIVSLVDTVGGVSVEYEYVYDQAGRLIDVNRDGTAAEHYEYGANGNRTRATVGGTTVDATFNDRDQLLTYGDLAFTYTAAGEWLTRKKGGETTTYSYDVLGNLVAVTLPSGTQIGYLIDGLNRRIGRKVNGTLVQGFLYQDQLRPVAELNGSGNVVSRFVYAAGINVPAYMIRGGVEYRILTDYRGSVRLVVHSGTGQIAQRIDYDTFGNVIQDTNPGFQPFGFAGGLYDPDTKLVRFGARDYDPETGRWTAKDPILFDGGSTNLYAYSATDPLNLIDPFGLDAFSIGTQPSVFDVVFGGAGAVVTAASEITVFASASGEITVTATLGALGPAEISTLGVAPIGAAATGVVGAGVFGWGVGTLIDSGITRFLGHSLGEEIYNRLHPEDDAPAYDPTGGRRRRCP